MSPGLRPRHIGPHAVADFSLFTSRHESSLSFIFYVARASNGRLWAKKP
jgi:hypothetical protein